MYKFNYCIILAMILPLNVHAQRIESNSLVEIDNQKNADIVKINQLWKDYLLSAPDSLYNNPYWNQDDKAKYKSYDLLRSEGYMELYGLAKYGELKNLVLSIKPLDDKFYDIHSMYYWGHFKQYPYVLCTTHVLSFKDANGSFVLGNWLDYYSRNWKTATKGCITFHYQTSKRNKDKMKKAVQFLAFLQEKFDIDVKHLDVYISDGFRESQRLKGYGYDIGETAVSSTMDQGGTTDIDNNIIYSNAVQGEFYQHEMMRFVRLKYRRAHHLLTDGLSEYYSENPQIIGIPIQNHFRDLSEYLAQHPEIDLKIWDRFDTGNLTQKNYLIGLVIVDLIEKRCGHNTLLKALETVHTDEELLQFFEKELNIKEKDIDSIIRTAVSHYAESGTFDK